MKKSMFEHRLGSRQATTRLASILLVITVILLAGKVGEDYFLKGVRDASTSLFSDRLAPAATLVRLSDAIYQRRDVLMLHLRESPGKEDGAIDHELGAHEASIEHLVTSIENTYLVEDEARLLQDLRTSLLKYKKLESGLVAQHAGGSVTHDTSQLRASFDEVRQEVLKLTKVQQVVGEELKAASLASTMSISSILYLQLGVAFVLGLLASALALSLGPRARGESPPPGRAEMH